MTKSFMAIFTQANKYRPRPSKSDCRCRHCRYHGQLRRENRRLRAENRQALRKEVGA